MKESHAEGLLSSYCQYNLMSEVRKLLENNHGLDVSYKDAICFAMAIKHDSHEMFNLLLDYFKNRTVEQYGVDTDEYQEKLEELADALRYRSDEASKVSSKIQCLISEYYSYVENGDDIDFSDDDTIIIASSESESYLTEGNLTKFAEQQVELGGNHTTSFDHTLVGS
jgi:hypothetical protein